MSEPTSSTRKVLRETDVCPVCFKRDELFELELFEVHSKEDVPVWGCHRCELVIIAGSDYRRTLDYHAVMRLARG